MFARLELLSYVASHNKYYKYDDKKKKSRRNPIYLFTHQVSVSLLIKFEQTYTISLSNLQNYLKIGYDPISIKSNKWSFRAKSKADAIPVTDPWKLDLRTFSLDK